MKHLMQFCERVKNITGRYPPKFRTNRGGEFVSNEWKEFCSSKGILLSTSAAHSPQSNGIAESFNRMISDMTRVEQMNATMYLWAKAHNWATYLWQRLPHTALEDKTPNDVLYNKKPSIAHLHPFYSKCFLHILEDVRSWKQAKTKILRWLPCWIYW